MNVGRTLNTSELRAGDVVNCHGMRCLIDQEIRTFPGNGGRTVWNTRALVLNRDEVPDRVVPLSWTREQDGTHRWTIQGNSGAYWYAEV